MYVGEFKHTWRSNKSVLELVLSLNHVGPTESISLDKKYLGLPRLLYTTNLKIITKAIPPLSTYTKILFTQSSKDFRILSFLGIFITCNWHCIPYLTLKNPFLDFCIYPCTLFMIFSIQYYRPNFKGDCVVHLWKILQASCVLKSSNLSMTYMALTTTTESLLLLWSHLLLLFSSLSRL